MSLIHDSLRKLELEPLEDKKIEKDELDLDSSSDYFVAPKNNTSNRMWKLLIVVIGLILVVYAYLMLNDYKTKNDNLLKDIKKLQVVKKDSLSKHPITSIPLEKSNKNEKDEAPKVIVQSPVVSIIEPMKSNENKKTEKIIPIADKEPEEAEVIIASKKPIQNVNNIEPKQVITNNIETSNISSTKKTNTKPRAKIIATKNIVKKSKAKLTVKQTRQLINQLQIQIELGNNVEVTELLSKLKESSGKYSLVYLRMNAYWLAKNDKPIQAMAAYKKVLFYKPDDIQAGTNLALLEAKNNKIPQAIKRLNDLKKKHPTNKVIADYLTKIEGLDVK